MSLWTPQDAALLRQFLAANKGKLLDTLRAQVPKIEGNTFEKVAISAQRHAGAEEIIAYLENELTRDSVAHTPAPGFIKHND